MKKLMLFAISFVFALCLEGCSNQASSVGIIGGADGPTAIFVTSEINWLYVYGLIGVVVVTVLAVLIIHRKKK